MLRRRERVSGRGELTAAMVRRIDARGSYDEMLALDRAIDDAVDALVANVRSEPIDLLLFCPSCGAQHVDAPDLEAEWTNPPHRSHLCGRCGCVWRPSDRPTNGVARIETRGAGDNTSSPVNQEPGGWVELPAVRSLRVELYRALADMIEVDVETSARFDRQPNASEWIAYLHRRANEEAAKL